MELKDYTEEELRAELKRRYYEKKAEQEKVMRCRHCKHCLDKSGYGTWYICNVRTWGKKIVRNYSVSLFKPACGLFEKKGENQ